MNKIVLMRGLAPAIVLVATLTALVPAEAQTPRVPGSKEVSKGLTAKAAAAGLRTAYAAGDPVCTRSRKRLWTENGWIVRRVTLCP